MRSIDKITLEEHFVSLYEVYANFSPERLNCMQTVNNYANCYKLMYGIPVGINAKKILELGIGSNALSTYIFLEACKVTEGHLTSVELNENYNYVRYPDYAKNKWTIIFGDSATVTSPEIDKGGFDIIMIDTSHEREQTIKELNKYVPLLERGGFIYMHDTNGAGVLIPLMLYLLDNPNTLELFFIEEVVMGQSQMTILRKL